MNLNWQNLKRSGNVKVFVECLELDGLLRLGGGEAKFNWNEFEPVWKKESLK